MAYSLSLTGCSAVWLPLCSGGSLCRGLGAPVGGKWVPLVWGDGSCIGECL